MKELDFKVIKDEKTFLENYDLSDRVAAMGDALLRKNGLEPLPFGEDRRNQRVWEAGKDRPDRKILKNGREIALLDWKGKSKDYWMINERAYNGYVAWSIELHLPVYIAIWSFESHQGRFIKLPVAALSKTTEWDGNIVVVFDAKTMRPWDELPAELSRLDN